MQRCDPGGAMKKFVRLMIIRCALVVPWLGLSPAAWADATSAAVPSHATWAQEQATANEILQQAQQAFNDGDYGKARLLLHQAVRMGLGAAEGTDARELGHEITRRWRAEIAHRKTDVTIKDLLPSGSAEEPLDRRQQLLGLYSMQDVDGHEGEVGGWVYGPKEAEDYYRGSGCDAAAVLAHECQGLRSDAVSWQVWSMIGGAALGGLAASIYVNSHGNGDPYYAGGMAIYGVAGGFVAGSLFGGVMNYHCHSVADDRFRQAADMFNQSLKSRLKLSVLPMRHGALGQLSMGF